MKKPHIAKSEERAAEQPEPVHLPTGRQQGQQSEPAPVVVPSQIQISFYDKTGTDPNTGAALITKKSLLAVPAVKPHQVEELTNLCDREGYELYRSDLTDTGKYNLWFRNCRQ